MKTFLPTVFILFSLAFLSHNTSGQLSEPGWFITTWKTDNPGFSNKTSITIPTNSNATYNYNVDWNNDGTFDEFGITGNVTHDFGSSGTYTIRIGGIFPRIYFNNTGDMRKILVINQWGPNLWTSMANAFYGCENLNITAADAPNLSLATSMDCMFCRAKNLNADLSSWNVSTITSMANLFWGATNFNQPIGNWNVGNVNNMVAMFSFASSFNQPIGNWNVSNVTNMGQMFYATNFNQPIGNWNVGKVTNMEIMFQNATNFNQPIGNWNVSKVTNMWYMFSNSTSFNQAIGNWNIALVNHMNNIFNNSGLSTDNYDNTLIAWDAAGYTNKDLGNVAPLKYCAATTQRANLINKNWTITGDHPLNPLYSTNSGAWNSANTWSCQSVPLAIDAVIINPGHIISVPTGTFPVKNIVNNGTISIDLGGQIQINQ